eukprot:scaffold24093_cov105-Isochrysis_galbana.AAC.2
MLRRAGKTKRRSSSAAGDCLAGHPPRRLLGGRLRQRPARIGAERLLAAPAQQHGPRSDGDGRLCVMSPRRPAQPDSTWRRHSQTDTPA